MKRIAILHGSGLVGSELRERLGDRPDLVGDLVMLTTDDATVGAITDAGGRAAVVQRFEADVLETVDVLFACGPIERSRPALTEIPPGVRVILLAPDAGPDDGSMLVAGVNLDQPPDGFIVSPRPASVMLARLLAPLAALGAEEAVATVVKPVSGLGPTALDDLLEQTRDLLAFQSVRIRGVLEHQLAFNLVPTLDGQAVGRDLAAIIGDRPAATVEVLLGGVFHGLSASLAARFSPDPSIEAIRESLGAHDRIGFADEPETLGPIDAATSDALLIGAVEPGADGWVRIWAVMDNVRTGAIDNGLAILESL